MRATATRDVRVQHQASSYSMLVAATAARHVRELNFAAEKKIEARSSPVCCPWHTLLMMPLSVVSNTSHVTSAHQRTSYSVKPALSLLTSPRPAFRRRTRNTVSRFLLPLFASHTFERAAKTSVSLYTHDCFKEPYYR